MMVEIKNRFTGKKIIEGYGTLKAIAEEARFRLYEADLSGADLSRADLYEADLSGADLSRADLSRADLSGADLSRADLYRADLYEADLSRADLSGANLSRADLSRADLSGADLKFNKFPSTRLLSSIQLGILSDGLTLELMRRDAYAHPHPEKFGVWMKGGSCPYQNQERSWFFYEKKELWEAGNPTMRDSDLVIAICKEKGWKINGYLE